MSLLFNITLAGDHRNDNHLYICVFIRLCFCLFVCASIQYKLCYFLRLHIESPTFYQGCIPGRPRSSLKISDLNLLLRSVQWIVITLLPWYLVTIMYGPKINTKEYTSKTQVEFQNQWSQPYFQDHRGISFRTSALHSWASWPMVYLLPCW